MKRRAAQAERYPSGAQLAFVRATVGAVGATTASVVASGALAIRAPAEKRGRIG